MTADTRWLDDDEQRDLACLPHRPAPAVRPPRAPVAARRRSAARLLRDPRAPLRGAGPDAADEPARRLVAVVAQPARPTPSPASRPAGWVRRRACAEDRRGAFAELTPEGLAKLEEAAPGHVEAVRSDLFDALDRDQQRALREISDALVDPPVRHGGLARATATYGGREVETATRSALPARRTSARRASGRPARTATTGRPAAPAAPGSASTSRPRPPRAGGGPARRTGPRTRTGGCAARPRPRRRPG